jgi:hypothetical protein
MVHHDGSSRWFITMVQDEGRSSKESAVMRRLILTLILLTIVPITANAQALEDFSRLSKALNTDISLVEADGTVREGKLVAAGPDGVTMQFASGTRAFKVDQIASAERLKDGVGDGALKGAIFGVFLGLVTHSTRADFWVSSIAVYSGIGLALDAAQTHRETLYRAPPRPSLSLSFRF